MAVGLRQRHGRGCRGRPCECSWEAFVYSKRDRRKLRRRSRHRPPRGRGARRPSSGPQEAHAGSDELTVAEAGDEWFEGAREGSSVHAPATATSPRRYALMRWAAGCGPGRTGIDAPVGGDPKDVQDLVDALVAKVAASTVVVTISAVRVIYKRALARGEVAVNPSWASSCLRSGADATGSRALRSAHGCCRRFPPATGRYGQRRCTPGYGGAS